MSASDTETQKFKYLPGINKNTTELDAEGTYVSCDKVRFYYGQPESIGGWQKENLQGQTFTGIARNIHTWVDLDEDKYLGVGTHEKLQLLNGGTIYDVTPIDTSACASNVLNTSVGSTEVVVSIAPGTATAGDYFVFAEVTSEVGGTDLTSAYKITSVDTTYFTFDLSTAASATSANAGGTTRVDFLLPSGNDGNGAGFGWGAGTWDTPGVSVCAGWSEPRGEGIPLPLRQWSIDNYGEDMIANPRGGKIYRWEASAGPTVRAQLMSSAAPSVVNMAVVAQEARHVIAFGTHTASGDYDPMLIRWSDSEDFTEWTAAATNQAGGFRIENGSYIIGVQETKKQILVFTDESLYGMRRIGGQIVYAFDDLGRHNGLMGQNASVDVNGIVYWMGYNSFQRYSGQLQTLPCSVQEYIFDPDSPGSVNLAQKEKIFAATNREFNEIWWLYPSKNATEIDSYVIYNYLENLWYYGTIDRTVWHDVDIFERPYAINSEGVLYLHEQGKNDDTVGMKSFLVTAYMDLGDGDDMMFVDRVIPDNTLTQNLNYTFNYKKYPQGTETFTKGPFNTTQTTRKFHPRIRGRQIQTKYSTSTLNAEFRLGADRLSLKPDGGR